MSKTYRPYEPDQSFLLPPALTDWLPEGHLIYFLRDVVNDIDLSTIASVYEREVRGYTPYHQQMMVSVLLYAYCLGVTSSRKIARRLEDDVAFRVLAANNTPDFRTVSDFRKRHLVELAGLFVQVLRLCQKAGLVKVGRGLYRLPGASVTEHHTLAEAAKRVPKGVICLLSALQYHGITTQAPYQIWIAIDRKARRPRDDYPALRIVRFSGLAFMEGREINNIDEVDVLIYSSAKTVADCFKYRNKIGLDVAIEALQDCWHNRRCTMAGTRRGAGAGTLHHGETPDAEGGPPDAEDLPDPLELSQCLRNG